MKLVNKTGYLKGAKTAKNPVNIIPSNLITTQGMAFPIKANGKTLYPNTGQYKFPTSHVVETPLKQDGANELVPNKMSKTTLSKAQEIAYQKWMKSKGYNESDDYDMKGYWKKQGFKNLGSPKGREHFTDEFKRLAPFSEGDNYPTLSDESNRASKFDKRGQGTWVGEGDNAKYVNYQKGTLSISAHNKKQFADVANMKPKTLEKKGTLRQEMKKSFSTLNKPITFGQKPGSVGDKIGSVLNLGSSRPGQGYSITPITTTKETAFNVATGEVLGAAAKTPIAKKLGNYLITKTPLRKAYKLNPFSVKENPNVVLHRVQKPKQTEQYIMEQFNKPNPKEFLASNEPGWGRAFSSDPSDMYYYTNPRVMQTRGYTESPEILRTILPKKEINKFNINTYNASRKLEGLPLYNSNRPNSEFILPIENVINSKTFGIDDLDKLVKETHKFNTPHWLKGFKEIPKMKTGSKGVSLAFSRGEKDPKGGLTQKGVDKYNRATGGNLKMAVTTPPSKLKAGSEPANRRKSFCARMSGLDGPMKKPNGKPTRKALALRKWNC